MLILYVCYNAYTHTAYMHINSCIYVHLEAYQVALMVNPPAIAGDMRCGFDPWVRNIPWRRAWQSTSVSLPGESHGRRSLVGYSPQGFKDLRQDWSNLACMHTHKYILNILQIKLLTNNIYVEKKWTHFLLAYWYRNSISITSQAFMITTLNLVTLYTSLTALKKSFINLFLSTIQLPHVSVSLFNTIKANRVSV